MVSHANTPNQRVIGWASTSAVKAIHRKSRIGLHWFAKAAKGGIGLVTKPSEPNQMGYNPKSERSANTMRPIVVPRVFAQPVPPLRCKTCLDKHARIDSRIAQLCSVVSKIWTLTPLKHTAKTFAMMGGSTSVESSVCFCITPSA